MAFRRIVRVTAAIAILALLLLAAVYVAARRPSSRPHSPPDAATVEQLRRDVSSLFALGERSTFVPAHLDAAADFIERGLAAAGGRVERHTYDVPQDGVRVHNLIVEIRGGERPAEIVVVGAHYDSVSGTAGADDNASGVAALLALARRFANATPKRTLRLVAFANEEPPHFQSESMGSLQYARRCHERGERIVAMISLESIGYFDDRPGSQQYPALLSALYPDRGNFIAFASNLTSRGLTSRCVRAFRAHTSMPVESASLPEAVPGIGWSDQWSFWQYGWPAVMVTDTAPFRNPHYHEPTDTPETLDYERLAMVVDGVDGVIRELVGGR